MKLAADNLADNLSKDKYALLPMYMRGGAGVKLKELGKSGDFVEIKMLTKRAIFSKIRVV